MEGCCSWYKEKGDTGDLPGRTRVTRGVASLNAGGEPSLTTLPLRLTRERGLASGTRSW